MIPNLIHTKNVKLPDYVAYLDQYRVNSFFVEALEITSRRSQGEGECLSTRLEGFISLCGTPRSMASDQPSLFDDFAQDCSPLPPENLSSENQIVISEYEIRRSKRRKKSVGAYREQGKTIIVAPIRMSLKEVQSYADELIAKLNSQYAKLASNDELELRAKYLVKNYLSIDVFALSPVEISIQWVTNQNSRWGSCTPGDGKIRISHRVQGMPQYVIDAVLLHELVHLIVADHSPTFYEHLAKFEQYKLAKEYLAGYSFAQQNYSGG